MITTDVSRAEFTSNGSSDDYVFNDETVDIPVKEDSHIKVYVTDTGTITATNSTDKFTNVTVNGVANTAHGHTSGDIIKFGGTLPVGIIASTNYYVRDIVGTTFKVELSVGGGVVNITTDGSSITWTRVTLQTLGTHYTVAISTSNVATVSWMSGKRPLNNVKFYFSREVPYSQTTDLLNNSLIEAESLENQLDLIVNQIQQVKNTTGRVLKYSDNLLSTDATDISATLDVDASSRANKSLKFDAQGNLGVSIINIDNVQDHVLESKSYATESPAVVNHYTGTVATAQAGVYSAKEHASGSAVTTGSAKDFAIKESGAVGTTGEFSAKAYAQGGTGVTGASGSSKDWATLATTPSGTATDASAREWAIGTSTHKSDGSAKLYATKVDGAVTGSNFSAQAWAVGGTNVTNTSGRGSAKDWATDTTGPVDTSEFSAKEYAVGSTATLGTAKEWALGGGSSFTEGTEVVSNKYSARKYASNASTSATASASSASISEGVAVAMAIALG